MRPRRAARSARLSRPRITAGADLAPLSTLRVPARAAFLLEGDEAEPLAEALARPPLAGLPRLVLGEGSNVLFAADFPGVVLRYLRRGQSRLGADEERVRIRVEAAEPWDAVVQGAVAAGLWGIENLAAIPGSAGAAPVQNIGAYGRELAETLVALELLELASGQRRRLAAADCGLAYRASRFREPQGQDRWLILALELELRRRPEPRLDYPGLRAALAASGGREDDPAAIAAAVATLRAARLPDPRREPNAGSFFKNPVVDGDTLARLRELLPALPAWTEGAERFKLPAAALIEAAGLKGASGAGCKVSERHALVLVNHAGATGAAVLALARRVRDAVLERFGIALEPEPAIVGAAWH